MEPETETPAAALEWSDDIDAAPRYTRIWVMFAAGTYTGPYFRIAQRVGDNWHFDSKQVNHFFKQETFTKAGRDWTHRAKERTINAWAHLRHVDEQDPANLGAPGRDEIEGEYFE